MAEETLEPEEIEETRPEAAEDQGEPLGSEAPAGEAEEAEPAAEPQAPAEGAEAEGEGEPEVDFGVQVEDVGTLKKKVTITVPAERIDAKREEMFGELSTTAQVPGFRIGRAPRRLVVKRFGKEVDRDVRNAMIGESLGKALEKSQLKVIGEPDIDLEAIELPASGDMSYELEVEVAPEFDLPELEGIEVIRPTVEVTDERIDEAIDRMRLREVKYEVADEPAAEQDIVTGRAKVTVEGAEESETEVTLRVAPGQIEGLPLVDLGKELTGKEAGQAVPMTVKVPEVHPNEAWQGKEARIELTVGEVRKRRLPEVNDAYAERMGYESVGELREALAKGMKAQVDREAARALREQINEYLLSHTEFELPEAAARRHVDRVLQRQYVDLLESGLPREQVEERMTEIQASVDEEAKQHLKLLFIFQKIADDRGIEVTEEEVNSRVARMAALYRRRPERLRQELESDGTLLQVRVAIREEKVTAQLLRQAKITDPTGQAVEETPDEETADEEKAEAETPGEASEEETTQ